MAFCAWHTHCFSPIKPLQEHHHVQVFVSFRFCPHCILVAEESAEGDGSEADLRAQASCSPANYRAALASYKEAAAASKRRLAEDVCSDDTVTTALVAKVDLSVKTCAAFKDVVATSPWAAPIRETLKDNLGYHVLTGKVGEQWEGLEAALATGVKLYGPAPGAYGNVSILRFGAGGKAVMSRLTLNETDALWLESPATYRVGNVISADAVELEITLEGKPVTVRLERLAGEAAPSSGPSFKLVIDGEEFSSFGSECEA